MSLKNPDPWKKRLFEHPKTTLLRKKKKNSIGGSNDSYGRKTIIQTTYSSICVRSCVPLKPEKSWHFPHPTVDNHMHFCLVHPSFKHGWRLSLRRPELHQFNYFFGRKVLIPQPIDPPGERQLRYIHPQPLEQTSQTQGLAQEVYMIEKIDITVPNYINGFF